MRNPQHQSHFYFALLMAIILALPILGLLSDSAVGQVTAEQSARDGGRDTENISSKNTNAKNADTKNADTKNTEVNSLDPAQKNIWQAGLVAGAIFANPNLTQTQIETQISNNQVTLRGTVETEEQRALAEQIALTVAGIDEVFNELIVDDLAVTAQAQQRQGDVFTDAAVTTKVKSQLLANPETSGLDIDVGTYRQVVTLSGEVDSEIEKDLAYYITRNTEGVGEIVNELKVRHPG